MQRHCPESVGIHLRQTAPSDVPTRCIQWKLHQGELIGVAFAQRAPWKRLAWLVCPWPGAPPDSTRVHHAACPPTPAVSFRASTPEWPDSLVQNCKPPKSLIRSLFKPPRHPGRSGPVPFSRSTAVFPSKNILHIPFSLSLVGALLHPVLPAVQKALSLALPQTFLN